MKTASLAALLTLLLAVSAVVAAGVGQAHLPPGAVWTALRHGPNGTADNDLILWSLRLPRLCLAALVGASLAAAGVAFQALLRNDLADPYLVGVSAGASVGSEAMLLAHKDALWNGFGLPLAAFAAAAAAMTTVYALARRRGRVLGDLPAAGRRRRQCVFRRRLGAACFSSAARTTRSICCSA